MLDLSNFNRILVDKNSRTATVGAGVILENLLNVIIPQGLFLPVTPGTRKITVGGAIAADVHGKNHKTDGSFGKHISSLLLIDGNGSLRELSPSDINTSEKYDFWATIGGMGLTGVIVEAKIKLLPITTSFLNLETYRFKDLDSIIYKMIENEKNYKYNVAWIDFFSSKYRGILNCGNHIEDKEILNTNKKLLYKQRFSIKVPSFFPGVFLNKHTIRIFNKIKYMNNFKNEDRKIVSINTFFYPLDAIQSWNHLYGSKGFIQYQFVVPDNSSFFISEALNTIKKSSIPVFLVVLKRFGEENQGMLSFPKQGWSLAIDMPANVPNIYTTLEKLDRKLINAGGRIYLAKDIRQSPETFKLTYPNFKNWKSIKQRLDPRRVFISDLAKRLNFFTE